MPVEIRAVSSACLPHVSPSAVNMVDMSLSPQVQSQPQPPSPTLDDVDIDVDVDVDVDVADISSHLIVETNLASKELRVDRLKTPTTPSSRRPSLQSRNSMNGPLYMQTSNNKVFIRRVKGKGDGAVKSLTRWLLNNQIGRPAAHGFSFSNSPFLSCLVSSCRVLSVVSHISHASDSHDGVWRVGIGY